MSELALILEACLLAAEKPLSTSDLLALFEEGPVPEPDRKSIEMALDEIRDTYQARPMELMQVASGYRLQVRTRFAPWVGRLFEEKPGRLSKAFLETLAIIVYRQPLTRGDIEAIRGVAVSSNIIRTLLEREWIRIVGRKEVPGRPALYATTRQFLDYFGLQSLEDLPDLETVSGDEEKASLDEIAEILTQADNVIPLKPSQEQTRQEPAE